MSPTLSAYQSGCWAPATRQREDAESIQSSSSERPSPRTHKMLIATSVSEEKNDKKYFLCVKEEKDPQTPYL